MNIGVLLPSPESGGVFQYALSIADSLVNYSNKFKYHILHCDFENPKTSLNLKSNKAQFISIPCKSIPFPRKVIHFLGLIFGVNLFLIKNFYLILKISKIDLLIIPTPFSFDFSMEIPCIVSIPDLMHKYYSNFPEYGIKQRISRNIVYKYYAKHSVLNIVDSQQGAYDLHKFFGIQREKTRVIPYTLSSFIHKYKDMNSETTANTLAKYILPEKFLFYPAQFWYHKNHLKLIKALNLIRETYGVKIPLVLVGSSRENHEKQYKKTEDLIKKLNLNEQVIYLGYVSAKEIVALYKRSTALVFPSLIGPTNIPPLEAMVLGTPVLCSNLFEMPKQIGNAGLLFDPFNIKDMAEKIYKIWINENLRQELIQKGFQRTEELTLENYAKNWERVIEEALKIYEEKRHRNYKKTR